jgi:hypothetical protein
MRWMMDPVVAKAQRNCANTIIQSERVLSAAAVSNPSSISPASATDICRSPDGRLRTSTRTDGITIRNMGAAKAR